jgi:tRNA (guanine-N7-)-methyltransferase
VELAHLFPEKNFIGIDIKGARMWTGAKKSFLNGDKNVAFLRTNIEMITSFFAENEVSEIWITFPDPQMKKVRKRLTSTAFMERYQQIMKEDGIIHLKTDSPFLYTYTKLMVEKNNYAVNVSTDDLYHSGWDNEILSIKTHYEKQWLERGLSIKYIQFILSKRTEFVEVDEDIEKDNYKSYNRRG